MPHPVLTASVHMILAIRCL